MLDFPGHLVLKEKRVQPGDEWDLASAAWTFVSVEEGLGYMMVKEGCRTLNPGELVIFRGPSSLTFRASQLVFLVLNYFHVSPDLLGGGPHIQ